MSNAVAIKKPKGNKDKKEKVLVPQSLPANFFKNYRPPAAPHINPQQTPNKPLPDFQILPPISPDQSKGINIKKTGSYSLKRNQHPMSMPVKYIMGPKPFTQINPYKPQINTNKNKNDESKEEPNSLEKSVKQLKVGSFTCFDVLDSPLKPIDDQDATDGAESNTASTFEPEKQHSFEDEAPEESDEEDNLFALDD